MPQTGPLFGQALQRLGAGRLFRLQEHWESLVSTSPWWRSQSCQRSNEGCRHGQCCHSSVENIVKVDCSHLAQPCCQSCQIYDWKKRLIDCHVFRLSPSWRCACIIVQDRAAVGCTQCLGALAVHCSRGAHAVWRWAISHWARFMSMTESICNAGYIACKNSWYTATAEKIGSSFVAWLQLLFRFCPYIKPHRGKNAVSLCIYESQGV